MKVTVFMLIFLITNHSTSVDGARILGYFPAPSKSHVIIHAAIANSLAEAGHEVTVLSGFPNITSNPKYKHVFVETPGFNANIGKEMINKPQPFYKRAGRIISSILKSTDETFSKPEMQQFLREHNENSFDLLILGYFVNDFQFGLAAHFKCPIILSFMVQPTGSVHALLGNPLELAYSPSLYSALKQPLHFWQRVQNFFFGIFDRFIFTGYVNYKNQELYDKHFPAPRYPSLSELRKNISLVFTNHHHISQGPIRPNVPALIDIGGIQIKEKPDPLPEDIASILDNSKEGVIFFSFGSNVKGDWLSEDKTRIFFNVLSKLPHKVLWKWSDADVPGISPNIFYKSWLPQDDILAHPNTKLFITHGGQGSFVESQYHGVPMVGIPFFGDQPANVENLVRLGFGVHVDFSTLSEDKLHAAILEVLQNPEYANAVQRFSRLYRDRPMTARESVVYWTEYVLRYNGAQHLQSPAVHLNIFQLLSLDVIAFLLSIIIIVVVVLVKLCKFLCCRRKSKENMNAIESKKNK